MRTWTMSVPALLMAISATAATNELPRDYTPSAVVASVANLHAAANKKRPEHLKTEGSTRNRMEFDVGQYFQVLKHVSPPEGHVLDYVYWYAGGNGRPHLYLRATNAPPFQTFAEYESSFGDKGDYSEAVNSLYTKLRLDGSPESFFERLVFDVMAGQFYLSWHENYRDHTIVTTSKDIRRIIAELDKDDFIVPLTSEQKRSMLKADLAPRVTWSDEKVAEVSAVIFSKWGGLFRITRRVSRAYPHVAEEKDIEEVVEYICGKIF